MSRHIASSIDIGSSNVRVLVCEYSQRSGLVAVRASVSKPSLGIRHGCIVNAEEATKSLRSAISQAEQEFGMKLRRAICGISGVALGTTTASGSVAISRADAEVNDYDVGRAITASESSVTDKPNLKIIHTIPVEWKVDGKKIMGRPHGIKGGKLEVKTLFITCQSSHLSALIKIIEESGVEIEDIFASPIAEAAVTLSPLQKNAGCILANIGSETVSTITFEEGAPIALSVFPIGSTDITNDIALGFKITLDEAEQIKLGKVTDETETKQGKKKLGEIIDARLSDIFELIETHLKKIGRNGLLPAGIVLTGGGINLGEAKVDSLAKQYLNLPATIGQGDITLEGLKFPEIKSISAERPGSSELQKWKDKHDEIKRPEWLTALGLCILGFGLEAEEGMGIAIVKRTRNKVFSWLRQFLP